MPLKAVILAGGFGTRISEESHLRPKPLIEIGGKPILWHIMKIYSHHGINDFVICCGYKGYMIKEYFANYLLHMSDVTINLETSTLTTHRHTAEPWSVTLIDTGINSGTGGRLKNIQHCIDDTFCMTYGDGVSNVNISALINFHKDQKTFATVTGISPASKYGKISINGTKVTNFEEKPSELNKTWINGGFFVLEPDIFGFIENEDEFFEKDPLENLVKQNQLSMYQHKGFWSAMDTLRDKNELENLWNGGMAPWKVW
jgi:glucose-1-phosphate cytidylyltransferase